MIGCGCRCLSGRVLLEIIDVLFFASDLVHSPLRQHPITDQFDIYTPHLPLPNTSIRHNGQGQLLRGYVCFCRKRVRQPGIFSVTGTASKGDTNSPRPSDVRKSSAGASSSISPSPAPYRRGLALCGSDDDRSNGLIIICRRLQEGCQPLQDALRAVPQPEGGRGQQDRPQPSRSLRPSHWSGRGLLILRREQAEGH